MTSTTIVWICAILLIAIFIIAMIGIFRANKANREAMSIEKIRRTWSVVKSNITDEEFNSTLDSILNTKQFDELRKNIGDKCPSNDKLKRIAFDRLHGYRASVPEVPVEDLLLSTTFRTEQNRIEFSIHPSSSLQGVVAYVSHPIGRTSA